jgi:V8-like Glu-specific endopeptidase
MRLSGFVGIASLAHLAPVLALTASLVVAGASTAAADQSGPTPGGTVQVIGQAAQGAALSFWTPARMAAATADATQRQEATLGPLFSPGPYAPLMKGAPRGTPWPVSFAGVPTVGALFYTKGSARHFCTASVISSNVGSLILTAAHCVYSGGYSANIAFVPGYSNDRAPYGAWAVKRITVAKGWRQRQDPSLDYAFLEVVPAPDTVGPIQYVTGALKLGFSLHDAQHITVIGYNDTSQTPIRCATKSFKFSNSQMELYCHSFWYGTSGGPWIINYNGSNGTGTVFGVIGGYEWGGYKSWASYSTILWQTARGLFRQAEASAAA